MLYNLRICQFQNLATSLEDEMFVRRFVFLFYGDCWETDVRLNFPFKDKLLPLSASSEDRRRRVECREVGLSREGGREGGRERLVAFRIACGWTKIIILTARVLDR